MLVSSGISLRMTWSTEQTRWLMKVLQPERTVASLPGAAALTEPMRAALLGLAPDAYSAELGRLQTGAKEAARELLADPAVGAMVDRLPLRPGARVLAFGDSHTSDPQSWAVILNELLAARRPADGISIDVSAVAGDTTTHGLIRIGGAIARNPDWILFFIGVNDARTQGPTPSKTLVAPEETARNLAELRKRVARETKAQCLWVTPPPVLEDRVSKHGGLSRFGVRFLNEDIARVAEVIAAFDEPTIELFARLGLPPPQELFLEDGLHFTQEGQKRIALEVVRGWADVRAR
ncbi:SGNH/GDSL hydrolase family protein [Myxococcus sp. K15C18031901]|uniref:SGNH/GDSL hydrolase family protein n=1 Tax=Myxococcus dinghuensis TaxID=2906761 RepID=UPI0020A73C98|nr:GDSL-type esterase/lipase family protein [Myxococcus dinghuensis]MCP3105255.1 SGNH/GDSL hydrolase family protein [Myxococcus dinghuensis]